MMCNEEALICDLAEVYHIYNYEAYEPSFIAILVAGLREDSRSKMFLSGAKFGTDQVLKMMIVDYLRLIVWMNTRDGAKNRNKPKSLFEEIENANNVDDIIGFSNGESFEKAWNRMRG
jgi:hypothetical protein|uniref:Uncharacterized protein n=1 Tax=Phage sp. ctgh419 TaxID=2828009 RepID=A0A8S5SKM1_9VIRU|nr:MAG TPA: protein of unknown function (DUF5361) [Phage sp. ctgh419]DAS98419.1 MAG TPA: protein of unknown function (DUF5361) [Caudoviricetes sp.]